MAVRRPMMGQSGESSLTGFQPFQEHNLSTSPRLHAMDQTGGGGDGSGDGSPLPSEPIGTGDQPPITGLPSGDPFQGISNDGGLFGGDLGGGGGGAGGIGGLLNKLFNPSKGNVGAGLLDTALLAGLSNLFVQKREPFTGSVAPQALMENLMPQLQGQLTHLTQQRDRGIQLPDAVVQAPQAIAGGALPFPIGSGLQGLGPSAIPGIGSAGLNSGFSGTPSESMPSGQDQGPSTPSVPPQNPDNARTPAQSATGRPDQGWYGGKSYAYGQSGVTRRPVTDQHSATTGAASSGGASASLQPMDALQLLQRVAQTRQTQAI